MGQISEIWKNLSYNQMCFLAMLVPMFTFFPKIYTYSDSFSRQLKLERPDYDSVQWSDLIPMLLVVPLFTVIKRICKHLMTPYFEGKLSKKYNGNALKLKVYKSTRNFFKIFYFTFITLFGFYVLNGTNYQTKSMFGNGDIRYLYSDWPYQEMPRHLKLYYLIGLSYHAEDTIAHFFHPIQNDFFEMLLHHYITLMLVLGSYMTSFWNIGLIVMIQMDNGDAIGSACKAFMDFVPVPVVLINYLMILFSWIYFRDIIFAIETFWQGCLFGQVLINGETSFHIYSIILLMGLILLNLYWTFLFFRMGYRFISKGEVKDLQNPIEDLKNKKLKEKIENCS
ncbi:unnamed protein product [Moneuplotes crassus]|uniref:TLC domain-containing protein n=1 Tax=Euplotes crassus TaxID=5936 RepID=A0AAD1XI29_EUPCR|nr:unnamed protein product [Moneuplotes crassus]